MIKYTLLFTFFICSFLTSIGHEHYYPLASKGMTPTFIQLYQNFIVEPANIKHVEKISFSCGSVTYFAVLESGQKMLCTHVSHGRLADRVIASIYNLQSNPPFCPTLIPVKNFDILKNKCGQ